MTRIGTAGWSIARAAAAAFPTDGSALERYASRLNAVEVNSSFYRPHKRKTWERWAASVPADFRFSVKLPKEATHVWRLVDCDDVLARFFDEASGLEDKLGVVLVQLPPSLVFETDTVSRFVEQVRRLSTVPLAFEPRHVSWRDADHLLDDLQVSRVAADPPRFDAGRTAGRMAGSALLATTRLARHLSLILRRSIAGPCPRHCRRLVHFRQHHDGCGAFRRAGAQRD